FCAAGTAAAGGPPAERAAQELGDGGHTQAARPQLGPFAGLPGRPATCPKGARQRPQECRPGARAARARGGARTRRRAPLSGPPRRAASRGGPASAGRWRRPPA
ncbi:unnamed protein product, partial [Prorocentrum cordatum]